MSDHESTVEQSTTLGAILLPEYELTDVHVEKTGAGQSLEPRLSSDGTSNRLQFKTWGLLQVF